MTQTSDRFRQSPTQASVVPVLNEHESRLEPLANHRLPLHLILSFNIVFQFNSRPALNFSSKTSIRDPS